MNRHGARTGKTGKNLNKVMLYNATNSTLTINRMKQHEILGQLIREPYIKYDNKLLSEIYQKEELLIFSSSSQKTIFSTAIMIKGLFITY